MKKVAAASAWGSHKDSLHHCGIGLGPLTTLSRNYKKGPAENLHYLFTFEKWLRSNASVETPLNNLNAAITAVLKATVGEDLCFSSFHTA